MTQDDLFGDLFDEGPPDHPPTSTDSPPASEEALPASSTDSPAPNTQKPADAGDLVFDIETGPVAGERLEELFAGQFDETKVKGFDLIGTEFDPSAVKLGNLKDQAKIDAKIDAKRKEHEKAIAEATIAVAQAREDAWGSFCERAPLSPITGRVLAIGYGRGEMPLDGWPQIDVVSENSSEAAVLASFWAMFDGQIARGAKLIGHNIYGFDLPFLVRRSWLLGVPVPPEACNLSGGRWQWSRTFVDTMTAWGCGVYGERISLDRAAEFFGVTRKNGDGARFHVLFHGTPDERGQAIDYLANDLVMTWEVAEKVGVAR